ncbi:uncharacterized protein LOC125673795 isoform X1 [Ostrea edulis]|uniref:uncharacterized protein LOC125673795 isoform X1 n=1 Tax=Ostrea edulis TaxID=37623 RepID=UPI0024AF0624|nr:uncharacterized protein LOC125673795 isoform X1 [Ostrea edulis]
MTKFDFIMFIACDLQMMLDSSGQRACNDDRFVIDNSSGQEISNNNILIDFGIIETQCDCKVSFNFSGEYFYSLAANPGYDGCGTAIEISVDSNTTFRLPCSFKQPSTVFGTSDETSDTVKLIPSVNQNIKGNSGYCVRIASNKISNYFHAYCGTLETEWSTTAGYQPISTDAVLQRNTSGSRVDKTSSLQWIVIGAASCGSAAIFAVFTVIIVWIHKRHKKDVPYTKKTLSSQQAVGKEKRVESGLKDNPLYQSADRDSYMRSQNPTCPSICNSLGLIENTLYQSADDDVQGREESFKNMDSDNISDLPMYSEINHSHK